MRRGTLIVARAGAALLLLALAAAGPAPRAYGEGKVSPVTGADFLISGPGATLDEDMGGVAWNSTDDEYLVVWADERNEATTGEDIYGRLVSAGGVPQGSAFRISGTGATGDESNPVVAWNSKEGQYLVVWTDGRAAGTRGTDVFGRLVSVAGVPLDEDFRITGPGGTADDGIPAVAWNATDNQYLVVWGDFRNDGIRGEDIYGRRVSPAGAPAGPDFRISGNAATSSEWYPSVAWDGTTNQYLVAWTDLRNDSTRSTDIRARLVPAAGAPTGPDFRVAGSAAVLGEDRSAVAWNSTDGEFLVVWQDERSVATRGWDIRGRRVSAAGAPVGPDFRISGNKATRTEGVPALAWNATSGQYLVVWDDERNPTTSGFDVYGRKVSAAGAVAGNDFRISGGLAVADEWKPAVAWNQDDNEFLVVRADGRNDATRGWDIFGRRVTG